MANNAEQTEALDEEDVVEDEIEIPETDVDHVKAGCRVLSRKLSQELEKLEKLNQTKAENAIKSAIGELDDIIPGVLDEKGIVGLNVKQRVRLKAAKGTNRGIFRGDWAAEAVTIAKHVEEDIAPLVRESADQREMVEA